MSRLYRIMDYLNNYDSLTPSDTQVGSVTTSEWWSPLKAQFDDLLWMYFDNRTVFVNEKFKPDEPDATKDNIVRTFAILLKSKKPQLDRMYDVLTREYNPIWNVDGVTGTIYTDTHTGTNTQNKTGTDTLNASGTDTNRITGSDAVAQTGSNTNTQSGSDSFEEHTTKDDTTRTGNMVIGDGGTDITNHDRYTFDDQTTAKKEGADTTAYGKTETTTYNSVKDAHLYDNETETSYGKVDTTTFGKTDTTTYGKVDTMQYGKQDQTTYNTQVQDTRNLSDEHIEMVFRQGNQGITMTQQMVTSEWELREKFGDFFKYVVHLCVNMVTYGVEGV